MTKKENETRRTDPRAQENTANPAFPGPIDPAIDKVSREAQDRTLAAEETTETEIEKERKQAKKDNS